ncbi:MAG: IS66 family transposase zinc-finger binding domain-containing protein [Flavobacteriaceae bacterium]|nr:IS66 family transposase zinc-finger binding domain-containing protein [Flavobacteriaceae bacterium]
MELEDLKRENQALKQQLDQLIKLINGFKSERFVGALDAVNQLNLFDQDTPVEEQSTEKQEVTYTRVKKQHQGRNKLPEHLPVKEIIIEPDQSVDGLVKIGQEVSETLEYTPASLVKRRTIRPKYA